MSSMIRTNYGHNVVNVRAFNILCAIIPLLPLAFDVEWLPFTVRAVFKCMKAQPGKQAGG